jgi:hypothetical protein
MVKYSLALGSHFFERKKDAQDHIIQILDRHVQDLRIDRKIIMCSRSGWPGTIFQNIFTNNFFKQIFLELVPIAN